MNPTARRCPSGTLLTFPNGTATMNLPSDFWAKIGHAESIIRCALNDTPGYPADLSPEELRRLDKIKEDLHTILAVGVK